MDDIWDCIVVGGGAAGLSAALVLGRARRRTLVVDAGGQSNRPAHGIGGLLGHDGRPPAELYSMGGEEIGAYPSVSIVDGSAVAAEADGDGDGFVVTLADGRVERTRRVLLAGGMDYIVPDVDGLAERWGRSVFHCPFCHGWEVRDGHLAVLDSDPAMAVHRALLLRNWSDDVTLLTNGATLPAADVAVLEALGVPIESRRVVALHGPGEELTDVELADGTRLPCDAILVAVTLHGRDDLAAQLGVPVAPPSPLGAEALAADPMGATAVPGVFAAGDVVAGMPSVANAIAAGSAAAANVVRSLLAPATRARSSESHASVRVARVRPSR